MPVAPSIAAAISTLSVPANRGTSPAVTSSTGGGATTRLTRNPIAITSNNPVMTRSNAC